MNNEFSVPEQKNNKKGLIILVIILSLLLVTAVGYVVYERLNENKDKTVEENVNNNNNSKDQTNEENCTTNETNETNVQNINDTTELNTSKKVKQLMEQYDLYRIITTYEISGAIDYSDLSKQTINNNTKSYMLKVMINTVKDESILYNDFEGTGTVIKLTTEEANYADSIVATSWMYISDFNDYSKNVYKSNISIQENDSSNNYSGCPSMRVYKDKMYLSYQCGFEGGELNPIYTSFVKEDNEIELYSIRFEGASETGYTMKRVKYTFEYNGKIWTLKEVEPIEIIK